MAKTLEQQIADTETRLARLRQKERGKDTRRKIIVGSILISEAIAHPHIAKMLVELIQRKVTRDVDKIDIDPLLAKLREIAETGAS